MNDKDKYGKWCDEDPSVPLFLCPVWMNAVCGDDWSVLLFDTDRGRAAYLYTLRRKYGLTLLLNPQLTPYQGFWMFCGDESFETDCRKQIAGFIVAQHCDVMEQTFAPTTAGLGSCLFDEVRRRTYRLENIRDLQAVWRNMAAPKQRQVKKGERAGLKLRTDLSVSEFYDLLGQDHGKMWYGCELLAKIIAGLPSNTLLWAAENADNQVISATLIVYDNHTAYYLAYATHPQWRSSGASAWLVWRVLQYLATETTVRCFDFEGSMDEKIAFSYRHFGAVETPFAEIHRYSPFGKIGRGIKALKQKWVW